MTFNLQLHERVWQRLNQSKIVDSALNLNCIAPIPLHLFDCLDSTNIKIWELIDQGMQVPLGVIALQQTAGKGQWGHSWVSIKGGLYLSVALDIDLNLNNYSHLIMATVWGITKVLRYYQLPVKIKWFNDLILEGCKLGGIKVETRNLNHRITKAVVGVGINWHNPVPDLGINLISYYEKNPAVVIDSLEELSAIASYGIIMGYRYYQANGIKKLLEQYTSVLHSIDKQIVVNDCLGQVIGITEKGKLKIRLNTQSGSRFSDSSIEIALAPGQISLGY